MRAGPGDTERAERLLASAAAISSEPGFVLVG